MRIYLLANYCFLLVWCVFVGNYRCQQEIHLVDEDGSNVVSGSSEISAIFLNPQPLFTGASRRSGFVRGGGVGSGSKMTSGVTAPSQSQSTSSPAPIAAQLKMEIDPAMVKTWPAKWWGCGQQQQQQQPMTTTPANGGEQDGEELWISSQIENLVLKAHIAIRAELLAATATGYPPPTAQPPTVDDEADSLSVLTKAEFKVLEIFRFSDLRGKGKPFLDAYSTNGRLLVSFRPSSGLLMASGMGDSDCFSIFQTQQQQQQSSMSISHSNSLRKRNIKVGLTYLLFVGITSAANSSAAAAVAAAQSSSDVVEQQQPAQQPPTPASQQLQYSLLAPPLVFHKRFRHSIYNVLCTDCTNAPLIKQLNIKYNGSIGVLSAYCVSPAHPIPTFTWSLDGVVLQENTSPFIYPGLEPSLNVLKIKSLRKNSKIDIAGLEPGRAHSLTCSAQNHFGHATLSQPFAIEGDKMSMLLLNDQHNKAFNMSGPNTYDGDYSTTPTTSLTCLQDFGRSILDWAFMNPWISVFIGLACVIFILAIVLLILKCVLRARYHSLNRHNASNCPHHHNRSPSLNAGTIVIDSSCTGDECLANSSGHNYLTAESKVPLLLSTPGTNSTIGKNSHLHHHQHGNHHSKGHHQNGSINRRGLAVMVNSDTLDGSSSARRTSPGSTVSVDDGGSSSGGDNKSAGNSTASSSAGGSAVQHHQLDQNGNKQSKLTAGSLPRHLSHHHHQQQQQQQHNAGSSTFRPSSKNSPATAPRPAVVPPVMTHSWHAPSSGGHQGTNNEAYHCTIFSNSQPGTSPYHQMYQDQPVMYNGQTLLVRQQPPLSMMAPPPPPPPLESDVIVRLLPALSAASSLAEFLGHENEHIEVVPEANEEQLSDDDIDDNVDSIDGDRRKAKFDAPIDSDEEIDQRRSERREFMDALQLRDVDEAGDNEQLIPAYGSSANAQARPVMSNSTNTMQASVFSGLSASTAADPSGIMSSSQNTAIFKPNTAGSPTSPIAP